MVRCNDLLCKHNTEIRVRGGAERVPACRLRDTHLMVDWMLDGMGCDKQILTCESREESDGK